MFPSFLMAGAGAGGAAAGGGIGSFLGGGFGQILGGLGSSAIGGLLGGRRKHPAYPASLTSTVGQERFGIRSDAVNRAAYEAGRFDLLPKSLRKLAKNADQLGIDLFSEGPDGAIAPFSGSELQRAGALEAIDEYEETFGANLSEARDRILGEDGVLARSRVSADQILGDFDTDTASLENRFGASRDAIHQATDRFVKDQTEDLRGHLFSTGNLRSSHFANTFANQIAPQAASGMAQALANLEGTQNSIFAQRAGQRGQLAATLYGGLDNAAIQAETQLANMAFEPGRFRANTIAQPSAIFASPFTRMDAAGLGASSAFMPTSSMSGLATGLNTIGGALVNQGLFGQGGLFPAPQPSFGGIF